jgi:hypothetical protein
MTRERTMRPTSDTHPPQAAFRSAATALFMVTCAIAATGTMHPRNAVAAEAGQSSYLKGYQDFLSGVIPPESGVYTRNDLLYYQGSISRTVIGGRVAVSLHEELTANITAVTYVTPIKILGATLAFSAAAPVENVNIAAAAQVGRFGLSTSQDRFGLGDAFFTPVVLGWAAGNFHWTTGFSVGAPTGIYHHGALNNTSLNRWAFMPQAAITYLDPKTGWDASAAFIYVASTENPSTNYQTGDILHVDFSGGRYLSKAIQVGIVGYYEQQLTGDSGSGALLGADKARVWALGLGGTYTFAVGQTPITATAKWTHEFAAQNTFEGDTGTVAVAFKF